MSGIYSTTDLQAVDFALGKHIAACYAELAPDSGPKAFQQFLARPNGEKIFYARNDDPQAALRKLARHENEPEHGPYELPAIVYYREQGLAADMNNKIQVAEVTRFTEEGRIWDTDDAMRVTTIPLTLTYSMLFLAWDRASIERMALAWWAFIAPLRRKHSRILVPYVLDGEEFEVGASISAPQEVLTSSEQVGAQEDERLWGSRTMVEVNTQAVYGARIERRDYFRLIGEWGLIPNG